MEYLVTLSCCDDMGRDYGEYDEAVLNTQEDDLVELGMMIANYSRKHNGKDCHWLPTKILVGEDRKPMDAYDMEYVLEQFEHHFYFGKQRRAQR